MKITVILCTHNRCRILAKALESVAASKLPDSVTWEVLVVDNNSSDQTREVVEDISRRHPGRFRYVFEPEPGKSHALNTGIHESRGGVLAFMDDDVTVEPKWLQNLTASLHSGEWAGAGGRTLLSESVSLPRWLALSGPHHMEYVLGPLIDLGNESRAVVEPLPYGANMAYRKEMFEKYGPFRIDLGPRPGNEIRNEDTEFGRRLLAAGEHLRYEPYAIAYHPVPETRVQKDFFLRWWFDYGRATIREVGRRPDIWGIPRRYISIAKITGTVLVQRMLRWILAMSPQGRFYGKCQVWMTFGQVLEIQRQWRDFKGTKNNPRPEGIGDGISKRFER
jgi:glycosyltransferase involved in cell wall biosynthesis